MAGADRDAVQVEDLGDVVRVDALDVEAHDSRTLGRAAAPRS